MQSKILERKKLVTKGGNTFVDLTSLSVRYKDRGTIINVFYAGEDMRMRPDLVSYSSYGNSDNFDMICKFNGISNPYSLDSNQLLKIPDLTFMLASTDNTDVKQASEEVRNQYIDSTKKNTVDDNMLKYENMVNNASNLNKVAFSKYNLPPNMAAPGQTEGTVNLDGTVTLGKNLTKN